MLIICRQIKYKLKRRWRSQLDFCDAICGSHVRPIRTPSNWSRRLDCEERTGLDFDWSGRSRSFEKDQLIDERERLTWTHVWNIFGDTTACVEEAWIDDTLQCLLFEWRNGVWNNTVVFPQTSKTVTHFCYDFLKKPNRKNPKNLFAVDFFLSQHLNTFIT